MRAEQATNSFLLPVEFWYRFQTNGNFPFQSCFLRQRYPPYFGESVQGPETSQFIDLSSDREAKLA